jgi:transposase-like protein
MVAVEYQRHVAEGEPGPVSAIARSHGVTPSASSRWVKAAHEKGLLEEAGDAS